MLDDFDFEDDGTIEYAELDDFDGERDMDAILRRRPTFADFSDFDGYDEWELIE